MPRIWFDTEFIDDGRTIGLLSIGMVRDDGRELYFEPIEAGGIDRASEWVRANVLPHLTGPRASRAAIAAAIIDFAGDGPEFWADHAAYDWVALCQLYGSMMDLPKGWPMFCRDIRHLRASIPDAVIALPRFVGRQHHALDDARHCRRLWEAMVRC
jgi:inhibitor of KinA sporulation pathway (predicted exonuclease)